MLVLIDRTRLASTDGKVVKADDFTQLVAAREILAEARQRATEILGLVEDERKTALKVGYRLGAEQARAEFAASMVEATAKIESAFIGLEARLVKTVMDALQRILEDIGDRTVMEQLIRRMISNAQRDKPLRLRVAAEQFDMVNEMLATVLMEFPDVRYIDVLKDPDGKPGTCVLESEFGIVDGSIDTQLAAVRTGLISAFVGKRGVAPTKK